MSAASLSPRAVLASHFAGFAAGAALVLGPVLALGAVLKLMAG